MVLDARAQSKNPERLSRVARALLLTAALLTPGHAFSDVGKVDLVAMGSPIASPPPDPVIANVLREISAERLRSTVQHLVGFRNRNTISSMDKGLPPGTGVTAAAGWIEAQFRAVSQACGGCLEVKTDTFTQPPQTTARPRVVQPTTITNVYAILRGSDPAQRARMYLVTGHYDSINSNLLDTRGAAPGANDDASGVAVSLECARVLSKHHFPATLVFATVAGEEQGLDGSKHLAELARRENWQLEGVLNNDIVGGDTTPGDTLQDKSLVRVFSEPVPANATPEQTARLLDLGLGSDSPSRELAREVVAVDRSYFGTHQPPDTISVNTFRPVMIFRLDRYLRGGDHYSFNQEGFAAVRFTEWRENFHHQHQDVRTEGGVEYGDEIKFDDFAYIANVTKLNAATLATLASAPGSPASVAIVTKALDNNTTLSWEPPASGEPAGTRYQIVWRETSAPNWQYALDDAAASRFGMRVSGDAVHPASGYTATLPISKDNVIFGIRACDAAGHCSPAVPATPAVR